MQSWGRIGGTFHDEVGAPLLTDPAVRKAVPRDKSYKLADAGGPYLFVMPSGGRSWRYKYRFAGKEQRLVFGALPATAGRPRTSR